MPTIDDATLMAIVANPEKYPEMVVSMATELLGVKTKISNFLVDHYNKIDNIGMDDEQYGIAYARRIIDAEFSIFEGK